MKKFYPILFLTTVLSLNLAGQVTETITVFKGLYDYKIEDRIQNGDTIRHWQYTFQNAKYSHITDIGGFYFYDRASLKQFADDILIMANKPKKTVAELKGNSYTLNRHSFSNGLFFTDSSGKYRSMTTKQAIKFANDILLNLDLMPE